MPQDITTIWLKYAFVSVNCYLLKAGDGYILIDTGFSLHRHGIERALNSAGCKPGNLKLIIITHADFDHIGNGAYLREKYSAGVAMHRDEAAGIERGDMLGSRTGWPRPILEYARFIALYLPVARAKRFKPDICLEDGQDLSGYGLDGRVVYLPGHTSGSLGVLTGEGNVFSGDLLLGGRNPRRNWLVDNEADVETSIAKLQSLGVKTVYPGHGRPFQLADFIDSQ